MYSDEKLNDFCERAEKLSKTLDKDEAFKIISSELDQCEDKYLNVYIIALNNIRTDKILDWIENSAHRIKNVNENWGHLAAVSFFTWDRADKWLRKGRPLSLIALDALIFCTTTDDRLNQSLRLRQLQPTLTDNPKLDIVATKLQEYLKADNVPRTRGSVQKIIDNIFGTDIKPSH